MMGIFLLYWFCGVALVMHLVKVATLTGINGEVILMMITEEDDYETREFFRENKFAYVTFIIISMVVISLIWPYVLYNIYDDDDYTIFRL